MGDLEQGAAADFVYGQFDENFSVDSLPDDSVYIGDRYRIASELLVGLDLVDEDRALLASCPARSP